MREYTWSEILDLELKYKDNHEVLELVLTFKSIVLRKDHTPLKKGDNDNG